MDINLITGLVGTMIGGSIGYIVPKINFNKDTENKINEGFKEADVLISMGKAVAPNSKVINLIDFVEKRAELAAQNVEQLTHEGDLKTNEEKFKTAQESVYNTLNLINVNPDDKLKKIIDESIRSAVNKLGHKEVSYAEKDKKINELQQQIQTLEAQKNQLQQTISQINASTAPVAIEAQSVQK